MQKLGNRHKILKDDLAKADPTLNVENAALSILIYSNVSLFFAPQL